MEEQILTGVATPEQIETWKRLHGEVYSVQVDNSVCYLRKPDRKIIKATAAVGGNDPIKASEVLLENCWLGGDEIIKTDDEKFFGVSRQLGGLVQVKQAELKKL